MNQNKLVDLHEVSERIRRIAQPRKIILFGSRARGKSRKNSDWDFLVIAESDLPRHKRSAPIYGVLSDMPVGMEKLVEICAAHDPQFSAIKEIAQSLTPFAVEARYDQDFWPDTTTAQEAILGAERIRKLIVNKLPAPFSSNG